MTRPPLLLTPGEPAGIGPELAVIVATGRADVVVIADPGLLERAAARIGRPIHVSDPADTGAAADRLLCLPARLAAGETPGRPDPANAGYVLDCLRLAAARCLDGSAAGLVTGPLQKSTINDAGIRFSGHTEFLAELAGVQHVVMLLTAGTLRVALATTHLPLRAVPDAITAVGLEHTLRILDTDLKRRFGISRPRILVLGLNPHAGENGHLGDEEQRIIAPLLDRLRAEGLDLTGPASADTAFVPSRLEQADAVLAMYHDQGLPVLKHAGFGHAVNVTLGLPFVRTSVDHGTALNLAGSGRADSGSLRAALDLAQALARRGG